jgi:hypothetical protein
MEDVGMAVLEVGGAISVMPRMPADAGVRP